MNDYRLLIEALGASQRLGMLGDLPIPRVIEHARRFVEAIGDSPGPLLIADIGSGGGVPGLVIAHDLPEVQVTLIDRRAKRTDQLERLVHRLELTSRVRVRLVDLTRTPADLVEVFDVVTARGFGSPDLTATAARPLLRREGRLLVSEPPRADVSRWTPSLVQRHGFDLRSGPGAAVAVLQRR
jgi:16S rRNA (guanine527-N7)-methyltransferase